MGEKLNSKETVEIAIQSGLQLVPYIGPSLSALYFGTKQEKRFKRIESFYQTFSNQIEKLQLQFAPIDFHDQEKLMALIEELNEKVERESTEKKRDYFKRYLYSTLSTPTGENFDERRFFLDILANMTLLECELLITLKQQNNPIQVGEINKPNTDQYAIVGAVGRLKTNGLIIATTHSFTVGGGDNALKEVISLSNFGLTFISYCLE